MAAFSVNCWPTARMRFLAGSVQCKLLAHCKDEGFSWQRSVNCWPIARMKFLAGSGFSVNCWPIARMRLLAGSIQCKLWAHCHDELFCWQQIHCKLLAHCKEEVFSVN